jgi:monoterpene epsilon-lactone hydrolase
MDENDTPTPVRLPSRDIPPPLTISDSARTYLATAAAVPATRWPPADDVEAWRRAIAGSAANWEPMARDMIARASATVDDRTIGDVPVYVAVPEGKVEGDGPVYLYIHGGAFVFGGGAFARAYGAVNADRIGCTVWSVDYRMPPDHPFPAAPEDCLAAYRALLERYRAGQIVIGGSSAGGNLAAATALMIRDRGLPQPAALVLLTPEVDLQEQGDSFRTNDLLDVVLKHPLPECNALYAGGHDLAHPYLSPLHAEFTSDFPPTLVQTGTRDLFLSNSVLLHRKLRRAGVEAELHVWEAMPHGGFGGGTPEDAEIAEEVRRFVHRHCGG